MRRILWALYKVAAKHSRSYAAEREEHEVKEKEVDTWRMMSCACTTIPPQIWRASTHLSYEAWVRKTSNMESAKLVELKGSVEPRDKVGHHAGR